MSAKITSMVLDSGLDCKNKSVLIALANSANDDGAGIFPDIWKLVILCGISINAVNTSVKWLKKNNLLEIYRETTKKPKLFYINILELSKNIDPRTKNPELEKEKENEEEKERSKEREEDKERESKQDSNISPQDILESYEVSDEPSSTSLFDMGKYNRIWKTKFGANLPYSRVIRRFRVLEEELGETTLYSAFAEYVKISDPHYASVFSFLSKPLAFLPRSCSAPAEYTDMVEL